VRTFLLFLVMASLSSPALAQASLHFDRSATRQAVGAVAAGPHRISRTKRLVRDTLIGAGAGAVTGLLLWRLSLDCGTCGPGPAHAVVSTGLLGAVAGAWVGVVEGWGAGRHPDIRTGRPAVHSAVAPSRPNGAVEIRF
jgi:hypothetical protein